MKKFLSKYIDDTLILIGCALILVWVYLSWPRLTWLVGGGMCVVAGVVIGLAGGRK